MVLCGGGGKEAGRGGSPGGRGLPGYGVPTGGSGGEKALEHCPDLGRDGLVFTQPPHGSVIRCGHPGKGMTSGEGALCTWQCLKGLTDEHPPPLPSCTPSSWATQFLLCGELVGHSASTAAPVVPYVRPHSRRPGHHGSSAGSHPLKAHIMPGIG